MGLGWHVQRIQRNKNTQIQPERGANFGKTTLHNDGHIPLPLQNKESLRRNTKWSVSRKKERALGKNIQTRNNKVHDLGKES